MSLQSTSLGESCDICQLLTLNHFQPLNQEEEVNQCNQSSMQNAVNKFYPFLSIIGPAHDNYAKNRTKIM
jgi:hypothetical protein